MLSSVELERFRGDTSAEVVDVLSSLLLAHDHPVDVNHNADILTKRKPFTANQQNEKKKKLKLFSKDQPTLDSFLQKKSQEDTTTAAKTESAHDQGLKNNGVSVDDHSSKDSDVSSVDEPKSKEMHFSPQKNKLPETIDANEYHQKDQPCQQQLCQAICSQSDAPYQPCDGAVLDRSVRIYKNGERVSC